MGRGYDEERGMMRGKKSLQGIGSFDLAYFVLTFVSFLFYT